MATRAKSTTRKRPTRNSVNARMDVLSVENKDEDFDYRIVNDTPGRVAQMIAMGYEMADGKEELISILDNSTDSGSTKSKYVGGDTNALLMKMPKEWTEEIRQEKEAALRKNEQQLKADATKDGYGKFEIE